MRAAKEALSMSPRRMSLRSWVGEMHVNRIMRANPQFGKDIVPGSERIQRLLVPRVPALSEDRAIELYLGADVLKTASETRWTQMWRGGGNDRAAGPEASVYWGGMVLKALDRGLRSLNQTYPGQRELAHSQQNPDYARQREPLIKLKREVSTKQNETRRGVRDYLQRQKAIAGEGPRKLNV